MTVKKNTKNPATSAKPQSPETEKVKAEPGSEALVTPPAIQTGQAPNPVVGEPVIPPQTPEREQQPDAEADSDSDADD